MSDLKPHVIFTKKQRSGILAMLLLIILLQCLYFFIDFSSSGNFDIDQKEGLAFEHYIDSLKHVEAEKSTIKYHAFNPNYIHDYKGYILGMSIEEIDRLSAYRASGNFIHSVKDFQQITKISDSLLKVLQPYFRFSPQKKRAKNQYMAVRVKAGNDSHNTADSSKTKEDINTVTVQKLKAIRGIGDILSKRIVKFRKSLGGFLIDEQLYDVYGLSAEVARNILQKYTVITPPKIQKININTSSEQELSSIVYIPYKVAQKIVLYRQDVRKIKSIEALKKIQGFPITKIDRIKLYLTVE